MDLILRVVERDGGEGEGRLQRCCRVDRYGGGDCADLNIVIRTAVLTPREEDEEGGCGWRVTIGAGGAITALSVGEDEWDEAELKGRAIFEAVREWDNGGSGVAG